MNEHYVGSSITENHFGGTCQHVDKSCHFSDPTSAPDTLDEPSKLDAPEDHLVELDSTSLMFQLQDTSRDEIQFVPELKEHLDNAILSQTDVFLLPMTMNCSY